MVVGTTLQGRMAGRKRQGWATRAALLFWVSECAVIDHIYAQQRAAAHPWAARGAAERCRTWAEVGDRNGFLQPAINVESVAQGISEQSEVSRVKSPGSVETQQDKAVAIWGAQWLPCLQAISLQIVHTAPAGFPRFFCPLLAQGPLYMLGRS